MTEPGSDPFALGVEAGERELLTAFLDGQRDALARKCAGLSDEQLRLHAVPSSNLTLLGLVRHLAGVERWYFQGCIDRAWPGGLYLGTDDQDEDFNDLEAMTGEQAFAVWQAEVETSRQITAEHSLDDAGTIPEFSTDPVTAGRDFTLRWVLVHLTEEYARHNGHADLIREAIDGQTGE